MWPGLYWLTLDTFYEVHTSRLHIYPSLKFSVFFVWQSASIVANSFGGHSTNSIARYKRPLRIEFHLLSPNLGPTCQGFPFLPHSSALPHRKLTTPCSALRPPGCLAPRSPPHTLQMLPLLGAFPNPNFQAAFAVRAFRTQ